MLMRVLAVLSIALVVAADEPKKDDPAKKDQDALQGVWSGVSGPAWLCSAALNSSG